MENMGFAVVTSICIIAYLIGEGVKLTGIDTRWIPTICGVSGGLLGIVGMFTIRDFPAGDIMNAAAVGIASGLAATGADQSIKIFSKTREQN